MIARQDRRTANRSVRSNSRHQRSRQRVYANQTRSSNIRIERDRDTLSEKQQWRTNESQFETRKERHHVKRSRSFKREHRDSGEQVRFAKKDYNRSTKVHHSYNRKNRHDYARHDRHHDKHYYGHRNPYRYSRRHHDHHSSHVSFHFGYGYPYYGSYYGHDGYYGANVVSVYSPVVVGSSYSYDYDDNTVDGYVTTGANLTYSEPYADEIIAVQPVNHVVVYGGPPAHSYWFWNLWASPYTYHRYNQHWSRFHTWWYNDYWPNTFWGQLSLHFDF